MFSIVIDVLEMILEDGSNSEQRAEANVLLDSIQSFEFVFNLHLMKTILAITSELSQPLQRKDQDIINAMNVMTGSFSFFFILSLLRSLFIFVGLCNAPKK